MVFVCLFCFVLFVFIFIFKLFMSIPFVYFSLIWCRYIRLNGRRYEHVLSLMCSFNGGSIKGINFENVGLMFVYVCFVLCLCKYCFCGLT